MAAAGAACGTAVLLGAALDGDGVAFGLRLAEGDVLAIRSRRGWLVARPAAPAWYIAAGRADPGRWRTACTAGTAMTAAPTVAAMPI